MHEHLSELEHFRAQKDELFATHPQSPLKPEQKGSFTGLHYFPENPDLRFHVQVQPDDEHRQVAIETSTGDIRVYERYGTFTVPVEGQQVTFTLFHDGHHFFLPFADSLAGGETYGAGRYLEPEELDDGSFIVDFNYAYNPYCAYNERWSCPLTPPENRVRVPIRAGEKNWESHD